MTGKLDKWHHHQPDAGCSIPGGRLSHQWTPDQPAVGARHHRYRWASLYASFSVPLPVPRSCSSCSTLKSRLCRCAVSEPTGVRELTVYPLSPTAVILSWQRPYHVAFRKYVLQTFFFNPVTLASEWTTYYEIAATASVIASVVTSLSPSQETCHGTTPRPPHRICLYFLSEGDRLVACLVL